MAAERSSTFGALNNRGVANVSVRSVPTWSSWTLSEGSPKEMLIVLDRGRVTPEWLFDLRRGLRIEIELFLPPLVVELLLIDELFLVPLVATLSVVEKTTGEHMGILEYLVSCISLHIIMLLVLVAFVVGGIVTSLLEESRFMVLHILVFLVLALEPDFVDERGRVCWQSSVKRCKK